MTRCNCALVAGVWLVLAGPAMADESAEAVDPKYTWDLAEIYLFDDVRNNATTSRTIC